MRVRSLEDRDDIRGILSVHARSWRVAYDPILPDSAIDRVIDPDPDHEHIEDRHAELYPDRDRVFLAEDDGGIVGYAYVRWGSETKPFVGPDEAGLKEIYVDPDCWGQGIGTALLTRCLDRLPDRLTALKLEALARNEVGSSFYSARGFEHIGTDQVEIGDQSFETHIWSLDL